MNEPRDLPRVLAIDDTPGNLLTLGAMLSADHALQVATSGAQGLALARENTPDIILLDIMMPGMDGYEACRHLRTDPRTRGVPVIFLTALNSPEDETRGLEAGAVDFITKPINPAVLRARIATQLRIKAAELATLRLEARYRAMIEGAHDGTLLVDLASMRVTDANPRLGAMLGYSREALIGMAVVDLHPHSEADAVRELYTCRPGEAARPGRELMVLRRDGSAFPADVGLSSLEVGGCRYMAGFYRDVSERKHAEEASRLAAKVFTHAREGILITDRDARIINVNQAFTHITGYTREEVLGQNPSILSSGRQGSDFYAGMWRDLRSKGHWYGEIWNRRKDGGFYAEMLTISTVRDAQGEIQNYMALFSDITALKAHESQLERIAHYDVLTGLPNRVLLADRMQQAMLQSRRHNLLLAVAYLDLDGFKAINDHHGHERGDHLLATVAGRMKSVLREGDTLSRIGGDEFVAVLLDLPSIEASVPMLTRLLAAAAQPVYTDDITLSVTASIGVTFYPHADDIDADQLLRHADQAMYQAKVAGKNRYHIFDVEQDRSVRGHHESVERIRQALVEREFVLHYQPKVNMRSGTVIGAEALIRWQHPERGLLPPAAFLPAIEEHPLSVELGEWVLDTALTQIEAWKAGGLPLCVSVNVSARQLQHKDFVSRLRNLLGQHPGVVPGDLELEILETSALHDIAQVSRVMEECQAIGVHFALDDFGTGYSSLTYLKRLPAHQLKIDQSFVRGMLDDPDDLAILEGVLGLTTAFRRQAIAEGVESLDHGEMLLLLGCDHAQGYSIARPMPAADLTAWHAAWQPSARWLDTRAVGADQLALLYAVVEHRAWVLALERYLLDAGTPMPSLDSHACRFGQWLDSPEARWLSAGHHARLDTLHEAVHTLAHHLLAIKQSGDGAALNAGLDRLHALRDELVELLHALRTPLAP